MVPYLQWELYRYYGDADLLAKHYDRNARWVDLISSTANDSMIMTGLGTTLCVRVCVCLSGCVCCSISVCAMLDAPSAASELSRNLVPKMPVVMCDPWILCVQSEGACTTYRSRSQQTCGPHELMRTND